MLTSPARVCGWFPVNSGTLMPLSKSTTGTTNASLATGSPLAASLRTAFCTGLPLSGVLWPVWLENRRTWPRSPGFAPMGPEMPVPSSMPQLRGPVKPLATRGFRPTRCRKRGGLHSGRVDGFVRARLAVADGNTQTGSPDARTNQRRSSIVGRAS